MRDQALGEGAGVATRGRGRGDGGQSPAGVGLDERLDHFVERGAVGRHATGGDDLVEGGQRVARRAAALTQDRLDGVVVDLEAGVGDDPADVLGQGVVGQQVELQVLGSADDGLADLLWVGGGQHEHHVGRRFFQRLQQRGFGCLRQHVDLVEDVHLAPPWRAEHRLLDEVSHVVDAVVGGRIQLVHVVAGARLDRHARLALATRFAIDRPFAVEHLGQDARTGGLPCAARPAEQVGVTDPVVSHCVAQRLDDVLLAAHVGEATGAVTAVERLVHRCEPTGGV